MQEINDDFLEEGRLVIDIDINTLLTQLSKERAFKKQALMIKSELKEIKLLERDISKITNVVHKKRKIQDIDVADLLEVELELQKKKTMMLDKLYKNRKKVKVLFEKYISMQIARQEKNETKEKEEIKKGR